MQIESQNSLLYTSLLHLYRWHTSREASSSHLSNLGVHLCLPVPSLRHPGPLPLHHQPSSSRLKPWAHQGRCRAGHGAQEATAPVGCLSYGLPYFRPSLLPPSSCCLVLRRTDDSHTHTPAHRVERPRAHTHIQHTGQGQAPEARDGGKARRQHREPIVGSREERERLQLRHAWVQEAQDVVVCRAYTDKCINWLHHTHSFSRVLNAACVCVRNAHVGLCARAWYACANN